MEDIHEGNEKDELILCIKEDELTRKIEKWQLKQRRREKRYAKVSATINSIWNKFFWFIK